MNPLTWLFNFFSGCTHRSMTRPMTKHGRTWVTCLECGKEQAYSWAEMKIVEKTSSKCGEPVRICE